MRVIRKSDNTRLHIEVCNEEERALLDKLFHRGLNTFEPLPAKLLAIHDHLKTPLCTPECAQPCKVHKPARGTYVMASGFSQSATMCDEVRRPLPARVE